MVSSTDEPSIKSGQRLCLACGLCCAGAVHNSADLRPEEVPVAESLGLTIVTISEDKHGFHLPCPKHVDDQCTIYEHPNKPRACGSFQCKLLRRYLSGEIGLNQSLGYVRRTRALIDGLRREMSTPDRQGSIWQQLAAWENRDAPKSPQARLDSGVLWWMIKSIFQYPQAQADSVDFPPAP